MEYATARNAELTRRNAELERRNFELRMENGRISEENRLMHERLDEVQDRMSELEMKYDDAMIRIESMPTTRATTPLESPGPSPSAPPPPYRQVRFEPQSSTPILRRHVPEEPTNLKGLHSNISSTQGRIAIEEVEKHKGKYVALRNHARVPMDIGGFKLRRIINGKLIFVYHIPPGFSIGAGEVFKIYGNQYDPDYDDLNDYIIMEDQPSWRSAPIALVELLSYDDHKISEFLSTIQ